MSKNKFTRRDFIGKTTAGFVIGAATSSIPIGLSSCKETYPGANKNGLVSKSDFNQMAEKLLPIEESYDYHKRLSTEPVHIPRRVNTELPGEDEFMFPDNGWKLVYNRNSSVIIKNAVLDFQDYLAVSQSVAVEVDERNTMVNLSGLEKQIVVGTKDQLRGFGTKLKLKKSYEIIVAPEKIIVCGFDERGVMFGLYDLESRMNLREAPILPKNLNLIRESLYDTRMVLSWMGWMEWPDQLLSHIAHDGFDGIFASVYANPNGDRTTAESSTDFYARILHNMRKQKPAIIKDLINRAKVFGIKVYTPIIYQYLGTKESELGLRKLVKEIVKEFPDIQGYVLLTEGFWYKKWGGGHGADKEYMEEWARNWSKAVKIVEEECHRVDPSIEIIPWEYNIDFRPDNTEIKRYFINQLPQKSIPMLTWENGKSFKLDGLKGHLRDYSLSQIGPAEVTEAQIDEAQKRGMKIFSKVDTFASWQFGTIPYLPCPHQWYERYMRLEKYGVSGTLESWSSGYKPNFISQLRAWTCWTNGPSKDELFSAMATKIFGRDQSENAVKAWEYFSQAIQLMPDTGPNMGTNNAIGNPIFFKEPPIRTATFNYSWSEKSGLNPYWPFTVSRMVFYPDFTNKTNKAEAYARSATGFSDMDNAIEVLPVFLKYLRLSSDKFEEGLKLYRIAACNSPEHKRKKAFKEVIVAEQIQRMIQSNHAILEFEGLRLQLAKESNSLNIDDIFDQMEIIVSEEITRTENSLFATSRDSRLGFQFEQDYVYTPYSLQEKLKVLKETLDTQLPNARKKG